MSIDVNPEIGEGPVVAASKAAAPEFPHYKEQEPDVTARFGRIYQRPVVMEVRGLCKTFQTPGGPVEVLRDMNFSVHRREFICVLGASGCGKSTLIRILAGLEEQTDGAVEVDGKSVAGPGSDRGMVFQSYTLFPVADGQATTSCSACWRRAFPKSGPRRKRGSGWRWSA